MHDESIINNRGWTVRSNPTNEMNMIILCNAKMALRIDFSIKQYREIVAVLI